MKVRQRLREAAIDGPSACRACSSYCASACDGAGDEADDDGDDDAGSEGRHFVSGFCRALFLH